MAKFLNKAVDYFMKGIHTDDDVPPVLDPVQELVQVATVYGVRPIVLHQKLYYYYLIDPGVQNNVNTFRDEITAGGFYLTAEDDKALEVVRTFLRKTGFKKMIKTGINDALITGNLMIERLFSKTPVTFTKKRLLGLDLVDMRLVRYVRPFLDDVRKPWKVVQILTDGSEVTIDYDRLAHYKMFEISKNFLGIGVFHSLAVPQYQQDSELRSILDDMQAMREAFPRIIRRHAKPYRMVIMENESEAFIKKRAQEIKRMEDGDWMFTNKDFGYKELTVDPRTRYDSLIEWMQLVYETGQQSPASKLQTTPGFTEASATQAREMLDRKKKGMQEDMKDTFEQEIFWPLLIGEGFDPEKSNVEFNFGVPEVPEFNPLQVLQAATTVIPTGNGVSMPIITWNEARKMLRNGASWELDPDETVQMALQEKRTPEEELPEVDKKKLDSILKKYDYRRNLKMDEYKVHVDRRFGDRYCFKL